MRRFFVPLVVLALAFGTSGASARTQPDSSYGPAAQIAPATVVDPNLGQCFSATLSGTNETPANTSAATGMGTFVLSPDKSALTYYITFSGLSSSETAAHFHRGAPGVAGPVVYPLPAGSPKQNTEAITAQDAADIQAGLWYVNIHSTNVPGGEIRGQLVPSASCYATTLSGAGEAPAPIDTPASGAATLALAPDTALVYYITFSGLSATETAAHFHKAALGASGLPVVTLPAGTTKRGVQPLTAEQVTDLKAGLWYVNVHSGNFPDGEIRGQIFPASNCFVATLSGRNEIPQNLSEASGMGSFSLTEVMSGTTTVFYLNYNITSTSIETPTVQHVHQGGPLVAGPVLFPLPSGESKIGRNLIDQSNITLLRGGLLYANLHSEDYPNGEIRGQLIPTLCGVNLPLVVR
jgi:hypothetical protein